jgi:transcriptional regulator with XRE-family HTH domain
VIDLGDKHGWTRRELAKRSGLHEQHLLKIEQGLRKRIESDTIIRLARAFACSADYLLGLRDEEENEPNFSVSLTTVV